MFAFVAAVILVYTSACAALLATEGAVRADNPFVLSLVLVVWAAPIGAAWLTAELLAPLLRHRRVLNPAFSWWLPRFVRGLVAGLAGAAGAVAFRAWFDGTSYDSMITAGAAAMGTAMVLCTSRRIRPGGCVSCGYDLRGLTEAAGGRCPECGVAWSGADGVATSGVGAENQPLGG